KNFKYGGGQSSPYRGSATGDINESINEKDEDISTKHLDPYQDPYLMHFLKYNRHSTGSSKKQVKRINKLIKLFSLNVDKLLFRKHITDKGFNLIVPKIEERLDLIKGNHNLGHFKSDTVYKNLSSKYYWKTMRKEIENFVNRCDICLRFDKKGKVEHPALALPIVSVFDRASFDFVLGFPENSKGYI
ncbi:unnamed protein product, partial [Brachionus calyciflorus]